MKYEAWAIKKPNGKIIIDSVATDLASSWNICSVDKSQIDDMKKCGFAPVRVSIFDILPSGS